MRVVVSFLASVLVLAATSSSTHAWTTPTSSNNNNNAVLSRQEMLKRVGGMAAGWVLVSSTTALSSSPAMASEVLNGVTVDVVKSGDGPKPTVGELVAIRFSAYAGDNKIDDIFDTPEPYYTRLGSGGLLKGVEQTLPLMRLGDRWKLTIPGSLAFGSKGRPASAGKPRIPADATIIFEVEMVGLPGKEPELIDLIGDD